MRLIVTAGLAGALLLSASGLCRAQDYAAPYVAQYGAGQPPPRSSYPDGTGNVAVDRLNSGQLDQNYRGPWYQVPARRVQPDYAAYPYATPGYGQPLYVQPAYPPPGY